jgi:hypothetical protein
MPQWSSKSPNKEAVYWFAYTNPDLHNRYGLEIRQIKKDREGKFYNASGPYDWDWGPDPKYLAMSHDGLWLEIEEPNDPFSSFGSASEYV